MGRSEGIYVKDLKIIFLQCMPHVPPFSSYLIQSPYYYQVKSRHCEVPQNVICSRPPFHIPTLWAWFALQCRWRCRHVPDISLMRMERRMTLTTSCTCRTTPLCTPPWAGCQILPSAARAGTGDCKQIRKLTVRWRFVWCLAGTCWQIFVWCLG